MRHYCANGPCDDSIDRGGTGCRLCDVAAKLPQPYFKGSVTGPRRRTTPQYDAVHPKPPSFL